jgi:hypothetical protein
MGGGVSADPQPAIEAAVDSTITDDSRKRRRWIVEDWEVVQDIEVTPLAVWQNRRSVQQAGSSEG